MTKLNNLIVQRLQTKDKDFYIKKVISNMKGYSKQEVEGQLYNHL